MPAQAAARALQDQVLEAGHFGHAEMPVQAFEDQDLERDRTDEHDRARKVQQLDPTVPRSHRHSSGEEAMRRCA